MTALHALSGPESAIEIIQNHIPSLTDAAEAVIDGRYEAQQDDMENPWDWAEFAFRECRCGAQIDGYYEYVEHLTAVLREGERPTLFQLPPT
jgi:hypothetical protein